ncbi:MAG: hypothetical protein HFP81_10240 [Methylococcales symbiont of Hymedesmia sp. n. MRB-2018]|nr:MAG: hypothetical protein HFP78_04075 [Methylococcales symbiont of Hymedesmia sp. n. MRB-2018]KAF3982721.1 MAG: hypothetical protein HFP81_10240 [Methylococcales symbiont of Hymedesmia sp. n. MRB-2018]
MNNKICFFSQMYQAIPSLVTIQRDLGGTFVCGRGSTTRYFRKKYPELDFAHFNKRLKRFSAGHKAMLNADCIVTGSPYKKLLSPYEAKKVMVFHGTYSGLTANVLEQLRHFDHLFLIGNRMEKMLLRYKQQLDFKYTKTGFLPFANFPDKNKENRRLVLKYLGLDVSLKTVVYCPTRRESGSWELCVEALIDSLSAKYNLILRPHPSQSMNLRWHEKSSIRNLQTIAKKRGNTLIDMAEVHFPDLLMIADLLISDANSPAEESLFYDTPQILTGLGKSSYGEIRKANLTLNLDEEDIEDRLRIFSCGLVFADEKGLDWSETVDKALLEESEYAKNRRDYFEFVFGERDKGAAHRVAKIIRSKYLR